MSWDWDYAASIMPQLLFGVVVTILVTIACSAIALAGGLLMAIVQMNAGRAGHYATRVLQEIFRGVPILVLLYFGFYALPEIGVLLPGAVVGILVLGVVYAAYCSEVYRGALMTIPVGLRDASAALGLSPFAMWHRVLIPIAVRKSLPALMNYVLVLYKQSSFLFAIGVPVLLAQAQLAGYQSFRYLEPYTITGVLYVLMNVPLVLYQRRFNLRLAAGSS
ncbi:MAG TPA: ABC transporter permease subunit [Reyranella sp.]|jgi:polar amino acid transport system permease protein|nr:ABC transporter permease subunit [Reyranella sp.]